MALHAAARQRRDSSPPNSAEYRAAAEEIARIEIQVARIEEPSLTAG
jgi:transcription elongation GreA/GreB family factor